VGVRSGGLPHFSSWFTLAGWVAPDRSNCGEPSSVVVLISLPRDQNAQTMQVQVPREPRATTYSQGYSIDPSIITTLSSRLSQSILLHCILYGCLLPSLLLHLRCEHERESTLECWELKDDPYLTQTALQYTFYTRLTRNHHRITSASTSESPSTRLDYLLVETSLHYYRLHSFHTHDPSIFTMSSACAYRDGNTVSLPLPHHAYTRSIGGKRDIS
jgi:hypothetical protein